MLLLDEPFGALDAKVRQELRHWLRRLHDKIHVTSVFVTHDQEEAFEVADRVVVMNQGRIEQIGTPQEVFDHPATAFVMNFLGHVNVFHGRVESGKALLGPIAMDYPEHPGAQSLPAAGYARPHELEVGRSADVDGGLWATVRHVHSAGAVVKLELVDDEGHVLQVDVTRQHHDEMQPAARRAPLCPAADAARLRAALSLRLTPSGCRGRGRACGSSRRGCARRCRAAGPPRAARRGRVDADSTMQRPLEPVQVLAQREVVGSGGTAGGGGRGGHGLGREVESGQAAAGVQDRARAR